MKFLYILLICFTPKMKDQDQVKHQNRRKDLQNDDTREKLKNFYNTEFKNNPEAFNDAKSNFDEKLCFSPDCKCIRTPICQMVRKIKNNIKIRCKEEVEPKKLYVFCSACAAILCNKSGRPE